MKPPPAELVTVLAMGALIGVVIGTIATVADLEVRVKRLEVIYPTVSTPRADGQNHVIPLEKSNTCR